MKKLYYLIILSLVTGAANAQFQWAKGEGLWAYDYGYGVATDNSGNLYVAGKYEQNAVFSGSTLNCTGNHDAFLAKYSPDGTIVWIRTAGGTEGDYAQAIHCDGSGFVYMGGEIEGFDHVISFPGSAVTLTCVGENNLFFAKYDLDGNLIWAKSEGYYNSDKTLGITTDAANNVYVCGYYSDTTRFNGGMIYGYGGRDIYVAKYNSDGVFQWVRNAGSAGRDEAKPVKCDAAGNVYICGMFSNNALFSGVTMTCAPGWYEAFLAKYSPDGVLQWVKKSGGDVDDVAWAMVMDNQGKIYVTGEFNAYAVFGSNAITSAGNADIFVACYDTDGNAQWVKQGGGVLIDRARGIGTDGTNLFITGQFGSTGTFGVHSINAVDSSDIVIASIDNGGNWIWAVSVGGVPDAFEPLGYESGNAVCAGPAGNVYATGGILNGGTFGPYSVNGYTRTDVFVTRLLTADIGLTENEAASAVSVYPNPANGDFMVHLNTAGGETAGIKIYNCVGQLLDCSAVKPLPGSDFNFTIDEEGVYFIEVKTKENLFRKKLMVRH